MRTRPQAITVEVGNHVEWHLGSITLNLDTIIGTVAAGLIVIGLGLYVARRASVTKPSKLQLVYESVVSEVESRVEESLGIRTAPFVVPMAFALFLFILIANWIAIIPTGLPGKDEYAPPPASDVNLTYALAIIVFLSYQFTGIRRNGLKYYAHIFRKPYILVPLNILEELIRPVTLALRLFGNIFAGVIMVSLIALFPAYILWAPDIIWKLFDMFIGAIQAFIFGLLTVLYFASVAPHREGAH
ncbi:F0F1 ATP synthase subunit A [Jatrophihabitans endophyticus]|uniref:F0F1 ATP synthase subunit A n=1 Tax=Jatrophihabitans endophyticus TaxID=1206085 RepID=UPI001A0D4DE7|nr:F0F1 ATP synthase subunit A [Jatrophihabitans endophyticus]MBE7188866.1 F0F1 ATP synthase subunit A [Jatrophihabitans endophyticus]